MNNRIKPEHTFLGHAVASVLFGALTVSHADSELTTAMMSETELTGNLNLDQSGQFLSLETEAGVREISFHSNQSARLDSLFSHAIAQLRSLGEPVGDVYWPSVRVLMNSRNEEVEEKRQQVLRQLDTLAEKQPDLADLLRTQVSQWRLAAQPYGSVSLEQARVRVESNPLLPPGGYTIVLPERPEHIFVYGFTQGSGAQRYVHAQSVRGYLTAHQGEGLLDDAASQDRVTVYRANGFAGHAPWGVYNASGHELQPGDVVWLGARQASAHGLLPFGPLGHGLSRETRSALPKFESSLAELVSYIVPDFSGETTASQPVHEQNSRSIYSLDHLSWEDQVQRTERRILEPGKVENTRYMSLGNYGNTGLMHTPTARMTTAGELSISYSDTDIYKHYAANMQLFDWLEASAFYVRIPNRLYSNVPEFSGDQIGTDKGFDLKVRLWRESQYMPEFAVGLRDLAGTGLFDGEYIVASKAYGPLDFSLGLGFGRTGSRDHFKNPFCSISDSFCERRTATTGSGGQFDIDKWFRGPTALFGGLEYQTPWKPLRVQLEYDANDYSRDHAGIAIDPRTPWNMGMNYRLNDAVDLRLGYERGDTLSFGFSLRVNFNSTAQTKITPTPVRPQSPKAARIENVDWNSAREQLRAHYTYNDAEFYVQEEGAAQRVSLYSAPYGQSKPKDKLDRTARIMAAELPETVTTLEVIEQAERAPLVRHELDLVIYRQQLDNQDPDVRPGDAWQSFNRLDPEPRPQAGDPGWAEPYPAYDRRWSHAISPQFKQSFGGPESFSLYQLYLDFSGNYHLSDKLSMHGAMGVNVLNNYDRLNYIVDTYDTPVPRVRTHIREYALQDIWLNQFHLNYVHQFSPNWYAQVYGGVLERMYSGVGGEVLYQPLDATWAFGLDINRVQQRDFSGGFGLRDYEVTTGHLSAYYDIGSDFSFLEDSRFIFNFGQFLAADRGVNITYQRRFDSGFTASAFAAFTDISSADFGEGSFNKGITLTIPFNIFTVRPNRTLGHFGWEPITRDGGQMLSNSRKLHSLTQDRSPFHFR